ncbi:hypothetical protein KM043_004361 [Ampulex compressa]|nr:hypothetical protein KM043_004361 [Ampulex compressa]
MVKLKWPPDKILLQKAILLSIASLISCGILNGYASYHKLVSDYMESIAYRQAREASKDYRVELMKSNRRRFSSDGSGPSTGQQD